MHKNTLPCINMQDFFIVAIFKQKSGLKMYKYRLKSFVNFFIMWYNP